MLHPGKFEVKQTILREIASSLLVRFTVIVQVSLIKHRIK